MNLNDYEKYLQNGNILPIKSYISLLTFEMKEVRRLDIVK